MTHSDKVILMHKYQFAKDRNTEMADQYLRRALNWHDVTVNEVEGWIADLGSVPQIYYEEYYEQIDVDRWSDKTAIFDKDGNHVTADQFREGDILELIDMPFGKNGCHSTGYAVWGQAAAGNYVWITEYEDED